MYYNSSVIDPILQELGYGEEVDGELAQTKPTWEQEANVSKEIINKINNGGISWEYKSNKYSIQDDIIPTSFNSNGYNANSFSFFLNTAKQWCCNDEEASTVYSNEKGQITFKNEIVLAAQEYFLDKAYDGLWNPSEYDIESLITISSISAAMNHVENEKEGSIMKIEINVDRLQLRRVFQNIILNAVHIIGAENGIISIEVLEINDNIEIYIRDNGTGIDENDIPNLFKPYFSKRQGGTGLGLAIVKKIVEEHSGTITAGNNEAGGAYFKIILPRGL